ncbi:type II secretion system F family protein [Aquabacter spiritensis]|uniref:Tight adherence protein C n=1 Tax=Aquabacter spiritensis TaxID=933073 RepID=A0A4R3M2T2_9HYPH|nr:type II secretion system F family protein [Aquabacter spiritensis]TCT07514.1 tight adherence protein C [Aquabacter spiritensis]
MDSAQLLFGLLAACAAAGAVIAAFTALEPDSDRERRVVALIAGKGVHRPVPPRSLRERGARLLADTLDLRKRLRLENVRAHLAQAGLRRASDEAIHIVSYILYPAALGGLAGFCTFGLNLPNVHASWKGLIVLLAVYAGLRLPGRLLKRRITRRQEEIQRAWPEALDLMLIQVEAGRSADQAFRRVADDIAPRCRELAIELSLTLAELQLLDRRQAYENFSTRTNIDEIKATCAALIQTHEQGTSLGEAFRVLAKHSRELRMHQAEKRAAEVTSMLPVPVFVFFLAPLVVMAVMPMLITYMKWK